MQFLITATFAVISLVGVASSCPSVCSCTDTRYRVKVDCSNRTLDRIPTNLPMNTNEFDLSFNQITAIKSDTFKGLPKLYWLHLESNKISVIEDNAFNSSSLGHIDLESNQIRSIKSDTFKDMPLLYDIRLRSNKISVIEENAFNNLARLRYLYLEDSKITSLKSGIFKNLPGLIRIYLSNNRISVIEANVFNNYNLPALKLVDLSYNKIMSIQSNTFSDLLNLQSLNMKNNKISFVNDKAFVNLPQLRRLRFDMYCGCNSNIPFWQWLRVSHKFSSCIGCYDYNRLYLENLQPNNFYKCHAINGNWGVWEAWGICSRTCGGGYSTRYRSCDSPPPAYGGSACTGVSQEAMQCSTTPCPVHGNWGEWGAWSSCSTRCGDGILTRYRSCDNPTPANGDSYCQGSNKQATSCITTPCPVASEEDSSSAAIAIGAAIGPTAVVVGLLIVFIYLLKRYRLRKRDPPTQIYRVMMNYNIIQNHRRTDTMMSFT